MKFGYVGLGKMGFNMVERLLEMGHQVVAYNRSPDPLKRIARIGAHPAESIASMVHMLEAPRLVWLMPGRLHRGRKREHHLG